MGALGILQRNSLENKQNCSVLSIALVTSVLLQRFTAGIIRSGFFSPHIDSHFGRQSGPESWVLHN